MGRAILFSWVVWIGDVYSRTLCHALCHAQPLAQYSPPSAAFGCQVVRHQVVHVMPPRSLRSRPSDASDTSAGSHSRGRAKLLQLAKRRPSPPRASESQGPSGRDAEDNVKALADAESCDSSAEEKESMSEAVFASEGESENDEGDEFKAKPDKVSKYVPIKKEKPKVLKMVVLTCKICGKSSKVVGSTNQTNPPRRCCSLNPPLRACFAELLMTRTTKELSLNFHSGNMPRPYFLLPSPNVQPYSCTPQVVKWSAILSGVGVDDKLIEIPDGPLCWPCACTCKVWPKEERLVINTPDLVGAASKWLLWLRMTYAPTSPNSMVVSLPVAYMLCNEPCVSNSHAW